VVELSLAEITWQVLASTVKRFDLSDFSTFNDDKI
jgi:hypothetical protein